MPEKGRANAELVKTMAVVVGLAKSQIELVSLETSRHKALRFHGLRNRKEITATIELL